MTVRADSFIGRAAIEAKRRPVVLRVTLPPRWAQLLIAAGARPAPLSGTVENQGSTLSLEGDPVSRPVPDLPAAVVAGFERIFGDRGRAEAFAADAQTGVALAFALSERLGIELAYAYASAIVHDLTRARRSARAFYRYVTHGRYACGVSYKELGIRVHAVDLAGDLGRRLADARLLAGDLAHAREVVWAGVRIFAPDLDLRVAQTRAKAVAADPWFDLDQVEGLLGARAHALILASSRASASARDLAKRLAAGLALDMREADLRGADLSAADITELSLSGVTWSTSTSWPNGMLAGMLDRSVEIEPGVFRVIDEGKLASVTGLIPTR